MAPSSLLFRAIPRRLTAAAASRLAAGSPGVATPRVAARHLMNNSDHCTLKHFGQMAFPNTLMRFGFSSASETTDKEPSQGQPAPHDNAETSDHSSKTPLDNSSSEQVKEADADVELSVENLVKLVAEQEEQLKSKDEEINAMKEKVLRSYAETENVIERTKRELESSKKFAVQNFSKSLLDVADNLGRASSVVKESFSKIDQSKDSVGAVPLLKTLLEGVEMTDKQLTEVFKKFGVEKFDPIGEKFDPHRHNALFRINDPSKPPGTVAAVLKVGYTLHERVLRPADVGVVEDSGDGIEQKPSN